MVKIVHINTDHIVSITPWLDATFAINLSDNTTVRVITKEADKLVANHVPNTLMAIEAVKISYGS